MPYINFNLFLLDLCISSLLLNFLLIFMNFTSCIPIPLNSLFLCTWLPSFPKRKKKSHCGSYSMSQCALLSTLRYLQIFIEMNHRSGSKPLASATLHKSCLFHDLFTISYLQVLALLDFLSYLPLAMKSNEEGEAE